MSSFKKYSKFYDLFYTEKNYNLEVHYVHELIQKYNSKSKSILDIGSGTGKHDYLFAKKGYFVTGIDLSEDMILIAKNKYSSDNTNFLVGDIVDFEFDKKFDVVCSLFHVFSYFTENDYLDKVIKKINSILNKGGLFIFDFWYGPAVLTDLPKLRSRKVEDENFLIKRESNPILIHKKNIVEIKYDFTCENKNTGNVEKFSEIHKMRYFFIPELIKIFELNGFEICQIKEFLSDDELKINSFGAGLVVKKK